MGCQSSKAVELQETTHQAPLSTSYPTAPTLLNHQRAVDLPPVEVQVIKQDNEQRALFTSAENLALPTETDNVAEQVVEQPLPSQSDQRPDMVQPHLLEAPNQEQQTTGAGNIGNQIAVKLPTACCESKESKEKRRQRDPLCWDCCEDKSPPRADSPGNRRKRRKGAEPGQQLESLIQELFRAHDLNSDGMLDEMELIRLNEAVAEAHNGNSSGKEDVHRKYSNLFREKFDPDGNPVPYSIFRAYMLEMLDEIDRHEDAQEMIVEQFLAEARLARTVVTGAPMLSDRKKSQDCCHTACMRFCPASEAATEVRAY